MLLVLPIAAYTLLAPRPQSAVRLNAVPYRASGIYDLGEKAGWTVSGGEGASGKVSYALKENDEVVVAKGELDLSQGPARVETTLAAPAMLYLELTGAGPRPLAFGAAIAPTKLRPVAPRPKDFDAFWKAKVAGLRSVPENAFLTPGESDKPDVEYSTIRMDHVNGTHVYGQIARPKAPGKHPAMLVLQWASPPYPLQKSWVVEPASRGWLTLNIEPHDVLPDAPPSYYRALPQAIKDYASIGQDDRETSYFVEMYLRDYRAVDYLSHCKDWDGKTLLVMGTSMGGQQSFAVAGLHPKVTHMIVNVPAGCDLNAGLHGRKQGYPFFPTNAPKVMEAARYVDAVNFASRIKAKSLVAMGFVDDVAPPVGIWTAFNEIRGPKEAAPMVDSPHNNLATAEQQRPYTQRAAAWLGALVKGGDVPAKKAAPTADLPIPRGDKNSQAAHLQLVEKARKGGIDVYFEGDSITRRWGTSDPAYRDFLANWNANFFGWNAADFGWGGDTTHNILWRLGNGELDGVHPKVVVLLAGTNNLGSGGGRPADADDVTRGIKAIVDLLRKKAPRSTLVLTALFPRNDLPDAWPTIQAVNRNLAALADGKRIRFVDVNDRLADANGKLFEGVTVDGLHPTVKGYQVWADALKPIFTEILGPPAKADHAPPPTGDPSARPTPTP